MVELVLYKIIIMLKIKDRPKIDRPREKLEKYGVERLKDVELLAILLRSGIKDMNVIKLSQKILRDFKDEKILDADIKDLQKISGLGLAKACEIVACFELGKRKLKDKKTNILLTPKDIWEALADIRGSKKEHFVAFYLNARNQEIKREIISIGTVSASLVHPREVFEGAIKNNASSIILAHNHPSGDTEPSQDDIEITKKLVHAGKILDIKVIDHVIVTNNKFFKYNIIMQIKKIQLKNGYKRFYNLTIDLGDNPKRIIALIGPNGCGKSSVLDGMMFLHNAHGVVGNKGAKDYKFHSMNQSPGFNHENINIDFISGNYSSVRSEKAKEGKEKTIFSLRSPYRYNNVLNITNSVAVSELRLNDYGASTSSDLDDKMEQNYRRLKIKYDRYLNDEDCKPSEAKVKIIGDLNNSLGNCLDLELVDLGMIEENKGTLFFKKTDLSSSFDFNVLSSGEKEVVDILLDLYLRQDEYDDTVFFDR